MDALRFSRKNCGEVTLHVAEAGPPAGEPVILLHGFPEFWFGWRHQITALADAGFRVIAPDQRGYNLSDKPRGVAAYDLDRLASDILGLADALQLTTFSLVGHDWGAAVAWWIAQKDPSRLRRLVIMDAPHPAIWRRAMDDNPEQRRLSRYVRLLGIPRLPELILRGTGYRGLADAFADSVHPPTKDEMSRYRVAWSQPGALTGTINWYRAILVKKFEKPIEGSIEVPTVILWGAKDKYALLQLAEASKALCARGNLTVFPQATHWIQHDEPDRVNAILLAFLK